MKTSIKDNVREFSSDALEQGGYLYTVTDRISTNFSNDRTTKAIRDIYDFRGKRVLDVGCGDGFFTQTLVNFGASEVVAIDPAENAIEVAKKREIPNVQFVVGDLYDLTESDYGRFDAVCLRGVIHHLPDPQLACKVVSRLADNVVGMEPNGLNIILKVIEKVSEYHRTHEEQSYLFNTVEKWFNEAGAQTERMQYMNLVPIFSPDWFAKSLKVIEPVVESVPVVSSLSCGQFVFNFKVD